MPLISIVIPSYNNGSLLGACLDSIQCQTFTDWEAVIVNDGSPDNVSEVAHSYADKDSRFVVVDKFENEGRHLARLTGTQIASGDYIMYVDADDELADSGVLLGLAGKLSERRSDIVRFGLSANAEEGMLDSAALGFTEWSNADLGDLTIEETRRYVFSATGEWKLPWHVTHRLFESGLAKRAFEVMANRRLDRAEDAYEYFVMASLAADERACCDIVGYLYHMGVGVTNARSLSAETFIQESSAIWDCAGEALRFAEGSSCSDLMDCAYGFRVKLLESMGNDLNERVRLEDREVAEQAFARIVGNDNAACEFWRFVRDRAWQYLVNDAVPSDDDELYRMVDVARAVCSQVVDLKEAKRSQRIRLAAEDHLAELEKAVAKRSETGDIRIFVATHRRAKTFESSIMDLVQVGSSLSGERFWSALHDDIGENISDLNPFYCELTAQYWAWKNIDAEYYGFCHYRRYFNFSNTRHPENEWGEIIAPLIDDAAQVRYGLTDESIREAVRDCDLIITEIKDLRSFPEHFANPREQWCLAENLCENDFTLMMDILAKRHPDYQQDIDSFLCGSSSCFCNMYVMRKEVFFDYCEWLFPLLDEFVHLWDVSRYSREMLRTPGHLAERLFNIYLLHAMRSKLDWTIKQVQCVHFLDTDITVNTVPQSLAASATQRTVVPIVLAADDAYVPMLTTTLCSVLENASPDCFYDITVLSSGISNRNREVMTEFLSSIRIVDLKFFDAQRLLRGCKLTTSNAHISVETYYRFLIQDVLPHYDKVLYLDSDLIVKGDVSKLMEVDLGDNLIAAVRDVDYLGNLNMGQSRFEYSQNVLRMSNPYDYFQAGVLVLNTAAMRRDVPSSVWFELAQSDSFIYDDQDILNACCEGRVTFLGQEWNVMHDCGNRIAAVFSHAPADVYDGYLRARGNELVIHYAGFEKPWNTVGCDRAEEYWHYARKTPYYESLVALFSTHYAEYREEMEEPSVIDEQSPLRKVLDPLMPYGSRRRELARSAVKIVRGMD